MQYWQKLHNYLEELDKLLDRRFEITLIGGAALILEYHHLRVTYDIDILNSNDARMLLKFVSNQNELNKQFNLPIHLVDASFFSDTRRLYGVEKRIFRRII